MQASDIHFDEIPGDAEEFLPVDKAFDLTAVNHKTGLTLSWHIATGYYVYQSRLAVFWLQPHAEPRLLKMHYSSSPVHQKDPNYGNVPVFRRGLNVNIDLQQLAAKRQSPLRLLVKYQGCIDAGLCYPVQWREIQINNAELKVLKGVPLIL